MQVQGWRVNMRTSKNDIVYNFVLLLFGLAGMGMVLWVKSRTRTDLGEDPWLLIYSILITTFQLTRIIGAIMYKHTKTWNKKKSDIINYEPSVSFVVPCKNEEKSIAKTVEKCFAADYPIEKLEVIVINDGSTDRTGEILQELRYQYPRLTVVDWKVNQGKRHGMAEGFRLAQGEIVVQLDSDSYIEPESFRKIIEPFAHPEIGAVCAHADPENADTNWLTKTQAAYYFMSFRVLKAAESTFMTVFCCSGCSSAYRKSAVLPILDIWLSEKFLGLPITWGDDRALTNWMLRQDYKTIYTDEVQAYTICPDNIKTFLKQQVRWKKGWFVNSLFASKFIWRKDPFVALTYFFPLILVTLLTPFMAARALIYNPLIRGISPVFYIIGVYSVAVVVTTYYRYVARENKYWPYMFVWSGINMLFLSYVLFYALATIQNRKWGTR